MEKRGAENDQLRDSIQRARQGLFRHPPGGDKSWLTRRLVQTGIRTREKAMIEGAWNAISFVLRAMNTRLFACCTVTGVGRFRIGCAGRHCLPAFCRSAAAVADTF